MGVYAVVTSDDRPDVLFDCRSHAEVLHVRTGAPVIVLGVNSVYHESSAALVRGGQVVAAAEEERFNRRKHGKPALIDNADHLPVESIRYDAGHDWLLKLFQVL